MLITGASAGIGAVTAAQVGAAGGEGAYIASKAALDTVCDAWQAETHADNVRFTTVHMSLVRTQMLAATTYDRFPVLIPDSAVAKT